MQKVKKKKLNVAIVGACYWCEIRSLAFIILLLNAHQLVFLMDFFFLKILFMKEGLFKAENPQTLDDLNTNH